MTAFGAAMEQFVDVLATALGEGVLVRTAMPAAGDGPEQPTVSVLLQSVAPRTVARGRSDTSFPVDLQVVVAVTAPGEEQADLLHDCWRAVLVGGGATVIDPEPIDPAWWLAVGATPRPAFRVRTPALIAVPTEPGPQVTQPLVVEHAAGDPSALRRQHAEVGPIDHPA